MTKKLELIEIFIAETNKVKKLLVDENITALDTIKITASFYSSNKDLIISLKRYRSFKEVPSGILWDYNASNSYIRELHTRALENIKLIEKWNREN